MYVFVHLRGSNRRKIELGRFLVAQATAGMQGAGSAQGKRRTKNDMEKR